MADIVEFPPRGLIVQLEIAPEYLKLVDDLRRDRPREEYLLEIMQRGLNVLLREARPDLNPGGKRRRSS